MKRTSPVMWVMRRIKRRIPALLLMTAAHVGSALLSVAFALGSRGVVDSAVSGDNSAFTKACIIQFGIILGILICLTVFRHLKEKISADLDRDWKRNLFDCAIHGEYAKVSAYHSGELLNRLNNDVRVVDDALVGTLPNVASMITKLVAAMAVLIAMEPWFAAVMLVAGVALVLCTGFLRQRIKGLHKEVSQTEGRVSGFIQETIEKLLMVQAMDVADEMERRADVLLDERYQAQRKRKNVSLLANTGISVVAYATGFTALVWCAVGLLRGEMTFGALTAVTQLVSQLQGPFVNLSGIMPQYIGMVASAERLMELDEFCGETDAARQDMYEMYQKAECITASGLGFSYDRDDIFRETEFSLPIGAFAVVTGASGIGKSTLLKLMLGVFKPSQGGIYLKCNGEDVLLNRSTRKLFAYVPQGNLIFSGTLRENITITCPHATDEEIQRAVHISAMEDLLKQLPHGLETMLGENGEGLSQGQVQRLAIARAVLSGAPVLLLDEITSSLDVETERVVLERIRALEGCTCIAVTHRPAATELADWELQVAQQGITARKLK